MSLWTLAAILVGVASAAALVAWGRHGAARARRSQDPQNIYPLW
jgi:hypothetical protein